jgi:hypothetical protein
MMTSNFAPLWKRNFRKDKHTVLNSLLLMLKANMKRRRLAFHVVARIQALAYAPLKLIIAHFALTEFSGQRRFFIQS